MVEDYFFGPNGLANQNMEANENDPTGSSKKRVIVFHCEFSSERAPAMLRFLRKMDRAKNRYPALDFPELYLLKDGYKVIIFTFHSKISPFCLILSILFWAQNEIMWRFWNSRLDWDFSFWPEIGLYWDCGIRAKLSLFWDF